MSKITISVDNTSDLGQELYKKYNLEVIYFGVVIGETIYRDTEVSPEDIYKAVEIDGLIPKTNAALEIDYRQLFEEAVQDGGSIIHFNISNELSASHGNAKRAAKGLERVYVIDSKSVSAGTGLLAIKASKMVKLGKPVEEIVKETTEMANRLDASFIIKDLNYLYRGGRASGLKLLGANMLKIRPSLLVNEHGKVVPDKKYKGSFEHAVKEWTEYKIEQAKNANKDLAIIVHSDVDEETIQYILSQFKAVGFKEVIRLVTGTTLTTHCGRNMVGAIFSH